MNILKHATWCVCLLSIPLCTIAQGGNNDCLLPFSQTSIHANEIRANILNNGGLFWDGSDAQFQAPFSSESTTSSIFSTGLWLASESQNGTLHMATATYSGYNGNTDYWAGPLDENGETVVTDCSNWDRIWKVYSYQIENHLEDFNDNGVIDNPQQALMEWPGLNNPYFEDLMGFPLPENAIILAPFHDVAQDGIYDPLDGDYPVSELPDNPIATELVWCIMNDNGGIHSESLADPLKVEIHLSAAGFYCEDNPVLNNTVFTSYRIVNKNDILLPNFHLGLFTDFDLGCYTDDYLGSIPSLNSAFAYNQDAVDGESGNNCINGISSYEDGPPAQSLTFLNADITSFMYFNNASVGNPPPGTTDPFIPQELYNYMRSTWRDGTPLSYGGDGYDPNGTPTNFAFPSDPNDPDGWSMTSELLPSFDFRGITTSEVGDLAPGGNIKVDIAWTFHLDPDEDNLGNVSFMYPRIEELKQMYSLGIGNSCLTPTYCSDDCVWPGDTNADGIANHCDLFPVTRNIDDSGTNREGPINWGPKDAMPWVEDWNGVNLKHADADGNATVTASDLEITKLHYGLTRPDYVASPDEYPVGPELFFTPLLNNTFDDLEPGESLWAQLNIQAVPDMVGLAYTLEFDPLYFQSVLMLDGSINCDDPDCYQLGTPDFHFSTHDEFSMAYSRTDDLDLVQQEESVLVLVMKMQDDFPEPLPSASTELRIKNIKAFDAAGNALDVGATSAVLNMVNVPVPIMEIDKSSIRVFPNPNNGQALQISGLSESYAEILLYDINGILKQKVPCTSCTALELPTSQLGSGMYILEIRQDGDTFQEKVLINR